MDAAKRGNLEIEKLQSQPIAETPRAPALRDTPLRKLVYLIVVIWAIGEGRPFLQPLFIAALLAFLMAPVHHLFRERLRFPDAIAILVSAITLLSPLALVIYALVKQGQGLVEDFPHLMRSAQASLAELSHHPLVQRFGGGGEALRADQLLEKISSGAGAGLGLLVGGLATLANAGSQGILIFVFSIMMLGTRAHLRRSAERLLAQTRSLHSAHLLNEVVDLVQRFLIARLIIVVIIGSLAAGALAAFRVQYWLFLGSFVGVMTLVPAVGFIAALVPTLIVAAVTGHSFVGLIGIAASLIAVNSLENYYLTPKMVGNRLNINALATMVGLLAGGLLWGIWGMLLSVPVLGVIRIAFSAVPSLQGWGELLSDSGRSAPAASPRPGRQDNRHAA